MPEPLLPLELLVTQRQLRLVAILSGAREAALTPIPSASVHTIAYLADALAPVWGIPIREAQLLKRANGPFYPLLQHELDVLVATGVAIPHDIEYSETAGHGWELRASYAPNPQFVPHIVAIAESFAEFADELAFVKEVILAVAGFGPQIPAVPTADAAYSSSAVGVGAVLNLDPNPDENPSAQAANYFQVLSQQQRRWLTTPELIHLYVRQLYSALVAA
jgi:hypothetical protein